MADTHYYYFFLFLLFLISLLLLKPKFSSTTTGLRLPPSPPALPIIGHLYHLHRPVYKGFQTIASKYGPLIYLRFGAFKFILISSSSVATEVFKTHDLTFSYKMPSPFKDRVLFGNFSFFNAPYGDYWRFMKKLTISELLGARQLQKSRKIRREERVRFLQRMMEKAKKKEAANMWIELTTLTNDTTCRMIMGSRCTKEEGEADNCREMVHQSLDLARMMTLGTAFPLIRKLTFWIFKAHFDDVIGRFDALLEKKFKEHEERRKGDKGGEGHDKDIMDLLLDVHEDDKAEVKITKMNMKSFIMDLFSGGTGTSGETMQWALAELINRPKAFKRLREEIKSVVGNRMVEESDIPNLPYLQAVVKETFRLYPALPIIPRHCPEGCKIGDLDIPKETTVFINAYAIMRDPKSWDDPHEFIPERFYDPGCDQSQKEMKATLNFDYIPFGMGRRMCPGSTLAHLMVSTAVASMVQFFDWKHCSGDPKNVKHGDDQVDMEIQSEIITNMARPLLCVPSVHLDPFAL